jgi:hypothetical protein
MDLSTACRSEDPRNELMQVVFQAELVERFASGSRTTSPYARWVGLHVIGTGLFYQLACYASYVVAQRGSRELQRCQSWGLRTLKCYLPVQELLNLSFIFYPNFVPNGEEADLHTVSYACVLLYFWTGWSVFTKLGISIMPLTTTPPYILNPCTW